MSGRMADKCHRRSFAGGCNPRVILGTWDECGIVTDGQGTSRPLAYRLAMAHGKPVVKNDINF
jgi:hypothetical protein